MQHPHRCEVLSKHEEQRCYGRLPNRSWPEGVVDTRAVHEAVEKAAGRRVPASTIYRMLARHGWHKFPRAIIAKSGIVPPSVRALDNNAADDNVPKNWN